MSLEAHFGDGSSVDMPPAVSKPDSGSRTARRGFRLPYALVEPAVMVIDFAIIVALSVLAGVGYHWLFLGTVAGVERYAAIGVLTFTNVCAILAARRDYR